MSTGCFLTLPALFLSNAFLFLFVVYGAPDVIPRACSPNFSHYPFCDMSLSYDERVSDLISRLTLDEKASLLTARESPLNFIPRLGIPEYDWGANCIHSAQTRCGQHCATVFPEPNALGATFNKSLVRSISVAIGLELRALWLEGQGENHASNLPHVGLDCWSPTVNIGRDPRWGRMYEIPSEDPLWNGVYGTAYTLGIQNGSSDAEYYDPKYYLVIATLKHFDAYSLENYEGVDRHQFNAIVSPYMFSDTYWPAFKMSIQVGGAKGVMCSYNAVNGVPSCCNDFLLNQTMRQEWGFTGYVTSDSGAISNIYSPSGHNYTQNETQGVIDALQASCDINSGKSQTTYMDGGPWGTGSPFQDTVPPAVNSGALDIKFVDLALQHTLKLRFELGLFDTIGSNYAEQPYWNIPGSIVQNQEHQDLNIFAARQSMTLLQNNQNTLPFTSTQATEQVLAVIGPHYNASADLLMANAYTGQVCRDGTFLCVPSVLQKFATYAKRVTYAQGCNVSCSSTAQFAAALDVAQKADYVVLMMGNDLSIAHENKDRVNISLPGYQQLLAQEVCALGKPTVLVLVNGGAIAIDDLKRQCPAVMEAWYPGFAGAQAIADTLFGTNNPGGKLAVTMYWSNYTSESDFMIMDLTQGQGKTYKYWRGTPPLFPFGYGLSYTQFRFARNSSCVAPLYCVDVENVGGMDGHETIFVFVDPPPTLDSNEPASKMITHLIDFEKVFLVKGAKMSFAFELDAKNDLMLYDSNGDPHLFAGEYKLRFSNGVDQNVIATVNVAQAMRVEKDYLRYRY